MVKANVIQTIYLFLLFIQVLYLRQQTLFFGFFPVEIWKYLFHNKFFGCIFCSKGVVYTSEKA